MKKFFINFSFTYHIWIETAVSEMVWSYYEKAIIEALYWIIYAYLIEKKRYIAFHALSVKDVHSKKIKSINLIFRLIDKLNWKVYGTHFSDIILTLKHISKFVYLCILHRIFIIYFYISLYLWIWWNITFDQYENELVK